LGLPVVICTPDPADITGPLSVSSAVPIPDLILLVMLAPLSLAAAFVLVESFLAAMNARAVRSAPAPANATRGPIAVLMPAHNESASIAATIAALKPELQPGDRILVVADNCTDATATLARDAGAEVLERTDSVNRGKGFALNAGLAKLAELPPAAVVFLDADCRFLPGTLAPLIDASLSMGRPAQACNLVDAPRDPSPKDRLSAFAFLFKNLVRPLGLHTLGLPCLLMGTGMAMPWAIAQKATATGALTEDIKLGIDLALAGTPPLYVPSAHVRSDAPSGEKAATTQRTRWEHGHVHSILSNAPRMFFTGLTRLKPSLMLLAIELAVPPLSLFVLLTLAFAGLCVALYLIGLTTIAPALAAAGTLITLGLAVFLGWAIHGRHIMTLGQLLRIPGYIAWKIPIYLKLVSKPETAWVRTERPS
jgi:cellulose synthase/poly-beta-1,6-N-acetylglucosamine synthase-like glycosyltransferase